MSTRPEDASDIDHEDTRALLRAAGATVPEERFEQLHSFGQLVRHQLDRLLELDLGESFPATGFDPRWTP